MASNIVRWVWDEWPWHLKHVRRALDLSCRYRRVHFIDYEYTAEETKHGKLCTTD